MAPSINKTGGSTPAVTGPALLRKASDDLISDFFKDLLSDIVDFSPPTETLISISSTLLGISMSDQLLFKDHYTDKDIDKLIKDIDTPTKNRLIHLFPDDSILLEDGGWSSNYSINIGDSDSIKTKPKDSDLEIQGDIEYCLAELRRDKKLWQEQGPFPNISKSSTNVSTSSNAGLSSFETSSKERIRQEAQSDITRRLIKKKGNEEVFLKYTMEYLKDGHDKQRDRLVTNSIMSLAKIEEQPEIDLEHLIVQKSLLQSAATQDIKPKFHKGNDQTHRRRLKRQKLGVIRMSHQVPMLTINDFKTLLDIPPNDSSLMIQKKVSNKHGSKPSNTLKIENAQLNPETIPKKLSNKKLDIEEKYTLLVQNINSIANGENSIEKLKQLAKQLSKNNKPRITKSSQGSKPKKQENVRCNKTQSSPLQGFQKYSRDMLKNKQNLKNTDAITLPKPKRLDTQSVTMSRSETKRLKRKQSKNDENVTLKFRDIWQKLKEPSIENGSQNEKEKIYKSLPKTVNLISPTEPATELPKVPSVLRNSLKKNLYSLLDEKEKEQNVLKENTTDLGDLSQISPYLIRLHHGIPEPVNPKYITSETRLLNSITKEAIKPISAEYTKQKQEEKFTNYHKPSPKFTKSEQIKPKKEYSVLTFNDILRLKILANNLTNYFRRSGRSFDTIIPLTVKYLYGKGRGLTRHQANVWKQYNNSKNWFVFNQQYGDTGSQPPTIDLPDTRKKEVLKKEDVEKARELRKIINAGGSEAKHAVLSLEKLIHRLYLESKNRPTAKLDGGGKDTNWETHDVKSLKTQVWSVQGKPLSGSVSDPYLKSGRLKDNEMPLIQKLLDDTEAISLTNVNRKYLLSVNNSLTSLEK